MSEFMLLLHYDEQSETDFSPAEFQKLVDDITAWHKELAERGRLLRSGKLRDDGGRKLTIEDDRLVVDGPFTETKEALGGFFLVEAADYKEAVQIAGSCPMLQYGGRVEIRMLEHVAASEAVASH